MSNIRNIVQTNQEREIVKTAPDLVVYIEGLPYLKNPFLSTNPSQPVLVNFNDKVTSFSANYSNDQMIPTATITLNVPNHEKYLYMAPGGNNLITTMLQVQVFHKGYYFASDGNSLYYRVFKGLTTHITHVDDGKALTITIQCQGIMLLFELMQIELSPALMSSSPSAVTNMQGIWWNMNPYQQMAFAFLYPSFNDGFFANSIINGSQIQNTQYFQAVQNGFVAKWQTILADICREAHLYGLQNKDIQNAQAEIVRISQSSTAKGTKGWSLLGAELATLSNLPESRGAQDIFNTDKIRQLHPEHTTGTIQLVNGRVVSRLEALRKIIQLINYEGYQDLDGQIIIKPPLYNLDVTNLGDPAQSDSNKKYSDAHPTNDLSNVNNPFILNLAEIFTESETEDQGAVRATRYVIQGNTTVDTQFIQLAPLLRNTAEYVDMPKLAKFGLREEPAKTLPWLRDADNKLNFAYAAGELAMANRAYRTYNVSFPTRPELKLGFPMYIPHKDMYGYIHTIGLNYTVGGQSTMTVQLDSLRKRPLYPRPHKDSQTGQQSTIFVSQPNLVLKWTSGVTPSTVDAAPNTSSSGSGPSNSTSQASLDGTSVSLPISPTAKPLTADQQAWINYQQTVAGSYFSVSSDTTSNNWRIQNDDDHVFSPDGTQNDAAGFYRVADGEYIENCRTTMPYTDDKGYELLIPFPWGRWMDIKTALQDFTRDGYVYRPNSSLTDTLVVTGSNTMLYAGLGTPQGSTDPSTQLGKALNSLEENLGVDPNNADTAAQQSPVIDPTTGLPETQQTTLPDGTVVTYQKTKFTETQQSLNDITVFELSYNNFSPGGVEGIISVGQPDMATDKALIQATEQAEQQKINVFLTGTGAAVQSQELKTAVQQARNSSGVILPPPVKKPAG